MKNISLLILAMIVSVCAAEPLPAWLVAPSLNAYAGYDSNPRAVGGTAATALLGKEGNMTYSAGFGFGFALPVASTKLTYAAEATRFDRWEEENFTTHRLGAGARLAEGDWSFTADGSSLFVDGSRETLPALAAVNANGMVAWRERRRQFQHRLKLQAQADFGSTVVRVGAKLVDYDYRTQVVPGMVGYADRADMQASVDLGWRQTANSLWLVGVRVGSQYQETLPGAVFDYSNNYVRLAAGWEGKPCAGTTVTFAAGPDFRHYSGVIDRTIMTGGRDRTALWFEGGFTSKLGGGVTITGKTGQMAWLSSTGKAAYTDTSGEVVTAWAATTTLTMRLMTVVHRCNYYPVSRDDWEFLLGPGATLALSKRTELSLDFLYHRGWDMIAGAQGREFTRTVMNLGVTIKL